MSNITKLTTEQLRSLPLWTSAHLAQFLGCAAITVEGWRRSGLGPPAIHLTLRQVRYKPADVDAWLEIRKQAGLSTLAEEQSA